jgi:hypothetical protein
MSGFNDPAAGFEIWVGFLFQNLLPSLFYVRNVIMLFDEFLSWLASVTLVAAKMLVYVVWPVDHDLVQYSFELGNVMSVRPRYDNR